MTLSVRMRSGEYLDRADRVHPYFGGFPEAHTGADGAHGGGRRDAASLDVAVHAQTAQLAALFAFLAALFKARS